MKNIKLLQTYRISELFVSFEGEGLRTGELAFFVRLYGCNLDCAYCDSGYATKSGEFVEMTGQQIVQKAVESGCQNVTVTGGEPLIAPNIYFLLRALKRAGKIVNVETNGSIEIPKTHRIRGLFYTSDYKCPSSGMQKSMVLSNLKRLKKCDCLKFVVGDSADLEAAFAIINEYNPKCFVYLSPVFGKISPQKIAEFMINNKLTSRTRLQVQLHKIVYPADMRGV